MRLLIPLAVVFLCSPLCAAEPKVDKDIAYGDPKIEKQKLDVHFPAEGKGLPIVVWIHGGGWQSGDKSQVDKKPQAFTDKGFVFVSVNYRLLYDVTIQQMAGDVAKAIGWIHDNGKDYGGDPDRLIVAGHSAGAQLAALVCTDEKYLKAEKLVQDHRGIRTMATLTMCRKSRPRRAPGRYLPKEVRRRSQPERTLTDRARREGQEHPPFLILHVMEHRRRSSSRKVLAEALKKAGGRPRLSGRGENPHDDQLRTGDRRRQDDARDVRVRGRSTKAK